MKVGYVRQFIVSALLIPVLFALWGCGKKPVEITQCFVAINDGDTGLDAVPPNGLIADPEKQCYGLKWSIPLAYEPFLFGKPVENLSITVGLVDQAPGAHMTDVRKARDKPEISLYPQLANEFQERIVAIKKASEETYGLKSTGTLRYGMEVYMPEKTAAEATMIMFYPVKFGSFMVLCPVGAEQLVEKVDPLTLCRVTSYMNQDLFAEYHVLYSLLPQLDLINSVIVNHILNFRVR
jgi:hypothetical protein